MADWKTYAKAARNTAKRQAQNASRTSQDRRGSGSAEDRPRGASSADRPRNGSTAERGRGSSTDDRPRSSSSGTRTRDEAPRGRTLSGGDYARAARRALDEGTRDSRDSIRRSGELARKDAAAYAAVAERRMKKAQLGRRITAAFRDALLVGLSLFIIWFVVTRTGVQIPFTAVLVVVGIIVLLRFGWALVSQFTGDKGASPPADDPTADPRDNGRPREYDPVMDQQVRDKRAQPRTERTQKQRHDR